MRLQLMLWFSFINICYSFYNYPVKKMISTKLNSHFSIIETKIKKKDILIKSLLDINKDFELYDVQKSLLKEIETNKDSFSIGTVLIPFDEKEVTKSKIKTYINFSNKHKIPFLFSRSTFPYKKIGILVSDDFSDNSPVNVAFDLASTLSADVIGLNVTQPKFLQSETTNKSGLYSEQIQDLALSNEVQCEIINAEGNEAKVFTSFTDKIDLSIISQTSQSNWQGKKIAEFVLQNSKSSVLYIPS